MSKEFSGAMGVVALIVAGCAGILGMTVAYWPPLLSIIASAMLAIVALTILVGKLSARTDVRNARTKMLTWTMLAFVGHVLLGLAVTHMHELEFLVGADSERYHNLAQELVHHWTVGGTAPLLPPGSEGYYYFLAGVYLVFGPYASAGIVLNAALGAALVPITTSVTHRLFGPQAARYTPALVILIPGLFFWTSLLLKESLAIFLVISATYCALLLAEKVSMGAMTGLAVWLCLLFAVRGPIALVVGVGVLAGVVVGSNRTGRALTTVTASLLFLGLVMSTVGLGYTGYKSAVSLDLERANALRQTLSSSAGSGFAAEAEISTPAKALKFLPIGFMNFAVGPFPWQLGGGRQLVVLPDVLVWWFLIPFLWRGTRRAWSDIKRRTLILALPALGCAVMLSLAIGDFGTLVRERMQVVILLVPLISVGLASTKRVKKGLKTAHEPSQRQVLTVGASLLK